jgi:hypothetical protein
MMQVNGEGVNGIPFSFRRIKRHSLFARRHQLEAGAGD